MFGPNQSEIWKQLCGEIKARIEPGGWLRRDQLLVPHRCWTMTVATIVRQKSVGSRRRSVKYTSIRVPFVGRESFRVDVVPQQPAFLPEGLRARLPGSLAQSLSRQDFETGDADFDNAFVVQGDREQDVRQLLASNRLRQRLQNLSDVELQVKRRTGHSLLEFVFYNRAENVAQLKRQLGVAALTMNRLANLELAVEQPVPTRIRAKSRGLLPPVLAVLGGLVGFLVGPQKGGEWFPLWVFTMPIGAVVGLGLGFVSELVMHLRAKSE